MNEIKYIYKYLTFDKFKDLMEKSSLYVPSLLTLKDRMDPVEGKIFDIFSDKYDERINNELNIKSSNYYFTKSFARRVKDKCINSVYSKIFIYSMCYDEYENYALWHIYSKNLRGDNDIENCIAFKFDYSYFNDCIQKYSKALFTNDSFNLEEVSFENIKYKSNSEIIKLVDDAEFNKDYFKMAYSIKSKYYSFAKEMRLCFINNVDEEKSYIYYTVKLQELFNSKYCKIILNPFVKDNELKNKIVRILTDNNIEVDELIKDSEIVLNVDNH